MAATKSRWFIGLQLIIEGEDWKTTLLNLFNNCTNADFIEGQTERLPVINQADANRIHIRFRAHFPRPYYNAPFKNADANATELVIRPVCAYEALPERLFHSKWRIDGPWHYGTPPNVGRRSKYQDVDHDFDQIVDAAKQNNLEEIPSKVYVTQYHNLKAIAKDNLVPPPDRPAPRGLWIYGESGVGKSLWVRSYYKRKGRNVFQKSANNKWWDGYKSEPIVLLDDFSQDSAKILGSNIKTWADGYSVPIEVKGSIMHLGAELFIVTSNYTIEEIFKPEYDRALYEAVSRRFKVKYFPHLIARIKSLRKPRHKNASKYNARRCANMFQQRWNRLGVDSARKVEDNLLLPLAVTKHRNKHPLDEPKPRKRPKWEPVPMPWEPTYADWADSYNRHLKAVMNKDHVRQRQQSQHQRGRLTIQNTLPEMKEGEVHNHHYHEHHHHHNNYHSHFHANSYFGVPGNSWNNSEDLRKTKMLDETFMPSDDTKPRGGGNENLDSPGRAGGDNSRSMGHTA